MLNLQKASYSKTDWGKIEAMTEGEIDKAVQVDLDCLPLS